MPRTQSPPPNGRQGGSRAGRLRATGDFDRVYRDGRRHRSRTFLVLTRRTGGCETRFGLSVSARLGRAVERNRIRRRIRELLRERNWPAGWDVVIQPRTGQAGRMPAAALREELVGLLVSILGEA